MNPAEQAEKCPIKNTFPYKRFHSIEKMGNITLEVVADRVNVDPSLHPGEQIDWSEEYCRLAELGPDVIQRATETPGTCRWSESYCRRCARNQKQKAQLNNS